MLGSRDRLIYGGLSLTELEVTIKRFSRTSTWKCGSSSRITKGSSSSTFTGCPSSPTRRSSTPGPGRTTRGRSATRLDLSGIPTVEVHLSDISKREKWRRCPVFEGLDLIIGQV
jgi:hypothetical protein